MYYDPNACYCENMSPATISIIIPVFNEEKFIERCVKKVLDANTNGATKEIIIIDDGSTDNTPAIISRIVEENLKSDTNSQSNIKNLINKQNLGKGATVKRGLLASTGDIVIIQDADLEYSPEDYPVLLQPFENYDADAVYGSRFISDRPHRVLLFWHSVANKMITTFSNMLTNINLTDMETGYKVFRGDLIRKIAPKLKSSQFGFEPEVTARLAKVPGIKIFEVGISYRGRTYAEGKKIDWTDGIKAIWEIIRYNLLD